MVITPVIAIVLAVVLVGTVVMIVMTAVAIIVASFFAMVVLTALGAIGVGGPFGFLGVGVAIYYLYQIIDGHRPLVIIFHGAARGRGAPW